VTALATDVGGMAANTRLPELPLFRDRHESSDRYQVHTDLTTPEQPMVVLNQSLVVCTREITRM
jgi:hypothetical protein